MRDDYRLQPRHALLGLLTLLNLMSKRGIHAIPFHLHIVKALDRKSVV